MQKQQQQHTLRALQTVTISASSLQKPFARDTFTVPYNIRTAVREIWLLSDFIFPLLLVSRLRKYIYFLPSRFKFDGSMHAAPMTCPWIQPAGGNG